jgi:hypothetical protein
VQSFIAPLKMRVFSDQLTSRYLGAPLIHVSSAAKYCEPEADVGVADVAGEGRSDDAQIRLGAPSQTAIRGGGGCRSPSPSVRVVAGPEPRSIGRLPQEPPQRPPQHATGPSRGHPQKERQAHAARATSIASTPHVKGPGFAPAGCRCRPVAALAESSTDSCRSIIWRHSPYQPADLRSE